MEEVKRGLDPPPLEAKREELPTPVVEGFVVPEYPKRDWVLVVLVGGLLTK